MNRWGYLENCAMDLDRSVSTTHTGIPCSPRLLTSPRPTKLPPKTMAPARFVVWADRMLLVLRSSSARDCRRHAWAGIGRSGDESQRRPQGPLSDNAGHIEA